MKSIITGAALAVGAALVLVRAYQAKRRDDLAAMALHGIIACGSRQSDASIEIGQDHFDSFAEDAYGYADAMRRGTRK